MEGRRGNRVVCKDWSHSSGSIHTTEGICITNDGDIER